MPEWLAALVGADLATSLGMAGLDRRAFLRGLLSTGALAAVGCADGGSRGGRPNAGGKADDLFSTAVFLGSLEVCEDSATVELFDDDAPHVKHKRGHNTRLFTELSRMVPDDELDLSFLDSESLVVPPDHFYIRTEAPDQLHRATDADIARFADLDEGQASALHALRNAWHIEIEGMVESPSRLSMAPIEASVSSLGATMMECAGNDPYSNYRLMAASHWDGIRFADFLDALSSSDGYGLTSIDPNATHVLVSGFDESEETNWTPLVGVRSTPSASWLFSIEELLEQGAFFATAMQGAPLTLDHGFPLRMVVPRYYGCTCIKWLNRIEFLTVDDSTQTTAQMREFADRTGQDTDNPRLLREHKRPVIDQAMTPIKVEKWALDGDIRYRVIGLMWGGNELAPTLRLGVQKDNTFINGERRELDVFHAPQSHSDAYTLWWSDWWAPEKRGKHFLDPQIADASVQARRLRDGYYRRAVVIDER